MCCAASVLLLLGPRFLIAVWWLASPVRWDLAFSTVLWPILGFVFMPWTTLAYVVGQPGGINGFDAFLIVFSVIIDVGSLVSGTYSNRDRVPGYATRY